MTTLGWNVFMYVKASNTWSVLWGLYKDVYICQFVQLEVATMQGYIQYNFCGGIDYILMHYTVSYQDKWSGTDIYVDMNYDERGWNNEDWKIMTFILFI